MKIPTLAQIKSHRKPDKIPPGWFTREQLQKEWGLSRDYTGKLIKDAMLQSRGEMKKYLVPTVSRGLYPTQHYRFR